MKILIGLGLCVLPRQYRSTGFIRNAIETGHIKTRICTGDKIQRAHCKKGSLK